MKYRTVKKIFAAFAVASSAGLALTREAAGSIGTGNCKFDAGADFRVRHEMIVAEMFQRGDYFDSGKPAYFVRWEINLKF